MREWDDLVAGALLGTERRATASGVTAGGRLLAEVSTDDPEGSILSAAALLGQWRRAGWIAPSSPLAVPSIAPEETLPGCSGRAAQLLQAVLDQRPELLNEWLEAAAMAGRVAPPEVLPELLELMKARGDLQSRILPVLGERGRWLAQLNGEWNAVSVGEDPVVEWETGTRDRRIAALLVLRERNARSALSMLEATWATEPPEDRGRYLAALETGLARDDEPFLERALDDRRKEVRTVAARLLSKLPESALSGRMRERLVLCVRLEKRFLGAKFEVTPPTECDKVTQRDGIEAKVPAAIGKVGERAWWLRQIIGACPPSTLPRALGLSASDLLGYAKKSEWEEALVHGWSLAASTFLDREWALLLLDQRLPSEVLEGLFRTLPQAEVQALALARLRALKGRLAGDSLLELALSQAERSWSVDLSREMLAALRDATARVHTDHSAGWALRQRLKEFAAKAPVALYPQTEHAWPESSPGFEAWRKPVADALATLKFRWEIEEEFKR